MAVVLFYAFNWLMDIAGCTYKRIAIKNFEDLFEDLILKILFKISLKKNMQALQRIYFLIVGNLCLKFKHTCCKKLDIEYWTNNT